MLSDGERIENHLRLVRVLMTSQGVSLEGALDAAGHLIPDQDREAVRQAYAKQTSTTIKVLEPGVLSDGGPRSWFDDYNPSEGYYWRRQRDFLAHDLGRKDFEIDSLDQASNKVLSHLENPRSPDPFDIRGLVIGHVQSGKTQNFSALIAKAADAGYKIVIVLSGLHNSLRQQTQKRLERDLGRELVDGVGEPEAGKRWQWMTGSGLKADFDARSGYNAAVLQGNEQVIFVVKKNKTRLEWLIEWMDGRVPAHVPVLVIDDESDQASINTGGNRQGELQRDDVDLEGDGQDFEGTELPGDELNPTSINKNIRKLLNQFDRSCYVAYTATPFANVLIDPDAFDFEVGGDLYPSHFIISLPAPPGDQYVGTVRLFGRERLPSDAATTVEDGLDVIEFVPDHERDMVVPPPRQRAGFTPTMPKSMKQALADYVLASAAWLHRSGKDEPCTMLIHTDMQRAMQNPLARQVTEELAYIRQRWLYQAEDYRPELEKRWNERFRPVSTSIDISRDARFEDISPSIDRLLRDGIDVRVLNSDHPDELDFDLEPTLKAVLIGGNKLSRGITIEGLMVSFYVRATLYYDTLLQMARWFGYRGRYVDLTRLYSTKDLVSYFHDLATTEEDLRSQIMRYERERLTPRQYLLRVRTHAVMKVTQPNKMRAADETNYSYEGGLIQTLRVPERLTEGVVATLQSNLATTRSLFQELGPPMDPSAARPMWSDVPVALITEFLSDFRVDLERKFDSRSVIDYIRAQNQHGELVRWRVLLSCANESRDDPMWSEDLGVAGRSQIPLISRTRKQNDPTSLGVVTDPDDELAGLSTEAIARADEEYRAGMHDSKAEAYRAMRDASEGLLIVYPVSPASVPRSGRSLRKELFPKPEDAPSLMTYAVSFPYSTTAATVTYVSAPAPRGPE